MRIGIAVKPGLTAARETLSGLEQRLRERGVDAVWSTDAAALFDPLADGSAQRSRTTANARTSRHKSTSVLVLGGDGTLLAMAKAIAESGHDMPILAVNFGSLGFLTEITRPEIFQSLDAVISGKATHDLRMMLRASATRAGAAAADAPGAERRGVHAHGAVAHDRARRVRRRSVRDVGQGRRLDRGDADRINRLQPGRRRPDRASVDGRAGADADCAAHADQPADRDSRRARSAREVRRAPTPATRST